MCNRDCLVILVGRSSHEEFLFFANVNCILWSSGGVETELVVGASGMGVITSMELRAMGSGTCTRAAVFVAV